MSQSQPSASFSSVPSQAVDIADLNEPQHPSPPSVRMIRVDRDNPPGAPRKPRPPRARYSFGGGGDNYGSTRRALNFDDDD